MDSAVVVAKTALVPLEKETNKMAAVQVACLGDAGKTAMEW